ncbi:MAG: phosphoglycerate dehydrogenase [Caulobacter sp.]|nr:phosphoglycerate dehydrogenase [Caulobacter sp.]
MPRVLIADKLSPAALEIFTRRGVEADVKTGLSKDELLQIIGDYDGLAVRSATKADKDVLAAARNMKVIGRAGIGVDNVDIPAATAKGVVVMNTPFGNSITTAEHAIALMFALARQLPAADASTQAGKWEKNRFMGVELFAKTLGLIGCGNIGSLVAERALGLKMKVIAFDPFLSPERAVELGVEKVELDELLERAEVITLHTPLTDKTRNILSAEALARTRKGVLIINCARGGLVDEAALRAALDSGQVGGAAFDVFVTEPAKENVLFGAENFIATPHLGASTLEAQENVALQVAEQISDYLLTGAVSNALNSPSITADEAPKVRPYVVLAEKLGLLAGQMMDEGLTAIEVAYVGDVARLNVKPMTAAALAGVLRPMLAEINMVSAPAVARERGVTVQESRQESSPVYDSLIRITLTTPAGEKSFAGAVMGGVPRIVEFAGMELDAAFAPAMLYVNNLDKPGFIGALGMKLAEAGINIATFNLGRVAAGDDAIALIGVDQAPHTALLEDIRALPHVKEARVLGF